MPLCARHQDARADRGGGEAVAPKPVNFLDRLAGGLTRRGSRRRWACGASASAARWRARPGAASSAWRKEIAEQGTFAGFEDAAPAASSTAFFTKDKAAREHERPVSTATAAPLPPAQGAAEAATAGSSRSIRRGTAPISGAAFKAQTSVWDYLSYGPFATAEVFAQWLKSRADAQRTDIYAVAVIDNGRARRPSLADGDHARDMGVIEVGYITLFAGAAAHAAPRPRRNICSRDYAFETLGYRRYEWKCNALNEPRAAPPTLRLHLRGPVPPAHDGEGQEPRHRLVLDPRRRMAGAQGRVRDAGLRPTISTRGPAEDSRCRSSAERRRLYAMRS